MDIFIFITKPKHMKNLLLITTILISNLCNAQYLMPIDNNWYTLTTDDGILYDDGGDGGNYTNNGFGALTIYPTNQSNGKIVLQFLEFEVEYQATCGYDYLEVYDGDDMSNLIGKYCGTSLPNSIESTHPTGAVTLQWSSDGSVTDAGFKINISVIDPSTIVQLGDPNSTTTNGRVPSYGYYDYSWSALIYNAAEVGAPIIINELQFDVENNINTTMTNQRIYMAHTTLDVFPNGNEPISGDVTISDWTLVYSGGIDWSQGWNSITLDNEFSYNGSGNLLIKTTNEHGSWTTNYPEFRYTAKSNSVVYNYNDGTFPSSLGYRNSYRPNMKLGHSSGGSLPITLIHFGAEEDNLIVHLNWVVASQINNNYFTIYKSKDGYEWEDIVDIGGHGTTNTTMNYKWYDNYVEYGVVYYKLRQTDYDGEYEEFLPIAVTIQDPNNRKEIISTINVTGQEINPQTKGLIINIYSDGSAEKKYNYE